MVVSFLLPYSGYIALAYLPALVWLLFYLHEDKKPEPKHLILLAFAGGVIAAAVSAGIEILFLAQPSALAPEQPCAFACRIWAPRPVPLALVLLGVAFIEETAKFLAVRFSVFRRPEFDEPIDAMIYMISAALGFAAIENVLFIAPVIEHTGISAGVDLTITRFLGANLLHALSSGIVGFAVARHLFSPWRRHAIFFGLAAATVLHAFFNYLILEKGAIPNSLMLVLFLLVFMAADVFVDFEWLKKRSSAARGA